MTKTQLIVGRQPVIEAIQSGQSIEKILLQHGSKGDSIQEILQLARQYRIPVQKVPPEKLQSMSKLNHQGVIALSGLVAYMELQQVIDFTVSQGQIPLFVMLDGVTDVRNIGAIARSALCCGAQALILPDKGVGALNEEAIKSSAGALQHIQVVRVDSLLKAVDTLHLNGIRVYTSVMKATTPVFQLSLSEPCCIIMGSEGKGVQPYLIKAADELFTIPMAGTFDSLNVSVAAGIILYEALKKRQFGLQN